MLRFIVILCAALFSSAAFADDPVYPPGSRVGLVPPPGMTVSHRFQGFEDRQKGVAIVLTELGLQSFEKVAAEFEPDAMKAGGMEEISREKMPLQRGDARLVVARHVENGTPLRKWALLTSAPGMTVIVLVMMPEAAREAYPDDVLRTALSSLMIRTKLTPDEMLAVLPFRLGDLSGFRMLRAAPDGSAVFTFGPEETTLPAEQPYFLVALRNVEQPPPAERERFAQRALSGFVNDPDLRIVSSEALRLGGDPAHEIIAESLDSKTKEPLMLVQWLRFGPGGVVQMFGMARKGQWADVLSHMRTLRDGFETR